MAGPRGFESRPLRHARTIGVDSANNWVQTLGDRLADVLDGYASPLRGMGHEQYRTAIRDGVGRAPLDAVLS